MSLGIYMFCFLLFVIGFSFRVEDYNSDKQKNLGNWLMQLSCLVVICTMVSNHLFQPEEQWGAASIQLVGNTVCCSHDGNIINLNTQTGCNFMPGDYVVIKATEGQWFLGVYYPETTKFYHWKELPAGMTAIKPPKKEEESNDA